MFPSRAYCEPTALLGQALKTKQEAVTSAASHRICRVDGTAESAVPT